MTHRSYVRQQILRDARRARRELRDDVDDVLRRAQESRDWPWTLDVSDLDPAICRDVARQVSALGEHEVVEVVNEDGRRALEIDRVDLESTEERSEDASRAIVPIPAAIPTAIASPRSAHPLLAALAIAGFIGFQMLLVSTALMSVLVMLELPLLVLIWGSPILRKTQMGGRGSRVLARGNVLPPAPPAPPASCTPPSTSEFRS